MFALAARFVDHDPDSENGDSDIGDIYASKAELLLAQHKQSSLSICIAFLLMGYRELGTGGSISWMYIGNAVRMAQDLGLHRDPSVWKSITPFTSMSETEVQVRRLLWWGVYVADRYISAWQGRPCAIHPMDFDTQIPAAEQDDLSMQSFIQVIKLSTIQTRVQEAWYGVRGATECAEDKLMALDRELSDWEKENLPAKGEENYVDVQIATPLANMYAQFWNCKILLHRPFIKSGKELGTSMSHLVATSSAIAISNLIQRSCFGQNSYSPFLNYYCFTAVIMHLFNRVHCPFLYSESSLSQCTNSLKAMAKAWPSARRTLQIIANVSHTLPNGELMQIGASVVEDTHRESRDVSSDIPYATLDLPTQHSDAMRSFIGDDFTKLLEAWDFPTDFAYACEESRMQ